MAWGDQIASRAALDHDENVTNLDVAFANNVTAGNTLIVGGAAYGYTDTPALTITDTLGTTYTHALYFDPEDTPGIVFIAYGTAPSSGACTVNVEADQNADITFGVDEREGQSALSVSLLGARGQDTAPQKAITAVQERELHLGVVNWWYSGGYASCTPYTDYTQIVEFDSDTGGAVMNCNFEYRIVTASGGYTTRWTLSASKDWMSCTIGLKEAAAASPSLVYLEIIADFV